ncbi:hypothetical protein HY633_03765 [Candidatus Uhrbacteria bacterium]|nr:hypothetical protein [Candidatus Uhrbacteria bacterium]
MIFDQNMTRGKLSAAIKKFRQSIRYHRDQKGDDRCWLDDYKLWALLEDTPPKPTALPPHDEMMARCRDFFTHRRADAADPIPADAQADSQKWDDDLEVMSEESLRLELDRLMKAIAAHRDMKGRPLTLEDDRTLYKVLPEKLTADFRLPPEGEFLGEEKANAGCPAFWRSHASCPCKHHDIHHWGPCSCD